MPAWSWWWVLRSVSTEHSTRAPLANNHREVWPQTAQAAIYISWTRARALLGDSTRVLTGICLKKIKTFEHLSLIETVSVKSQIFDRKCEYLVLRHYREYISVRPGTANHQSPCLAPGDREPASVSRLGARRQRWRDDTLIPLTGCIKMDSCESLVN